MLDRYGVDGEGLYEKIRDEIRESPLFRFDWFFLSRTPVEIGRRCTTLLNTVAKEFEPGDAKTNGDAGKGRGRVRDEEDEENEENEAPAKKKNKNGAVVGDLPWVLYTKFLSNICSAKQAGQGCQGWQQKQLRVDITSSQCVIQHCTQEQESQEVIDLIGAF